MSTYKRCRGSLTTGERGCEWWVPWRYLLGIRTCMAAHYSRTLSLHLSVAEFVDSATFSPQLNTAREALGKVITISFSCCVTSKKKETSVIWDGTSRNKNTTHSVKRNSAASQNSVRDDLRFMPKTQIALFVVRRNICFFWCKISFLISECGK